LPFVHHLGLKKRFVTYSLQEVEMEAPITKSLDPMAKKVGTNGFSVFRKMDSSPAVAVHGQVFTRAHIVDFILDLAGYTVDKSLQLKTFLEPGCGNGAFLLAAAKRLLTSKPNDFPLESLSTCLFGVEKCPELVEQTRNSLLEVLLANGAKKATARDLAMAWVVCDDFLAIETERRFEFIVGNPPYVRQEAIPKALVDEYRERFSCFYDRADLYIAFFERGLQMLSEQATLAFICPNRFTKNNYGRKLRKQIADQFKLTHVVDLPEASPFEPEVLSYPGIYVVQRGTTGAVDHVLMRDASLEECEQAQSALKEQEIGVQGNVAYHRYTSWFSGETKWATHSPAHLSLLRRLEATGVPLGQEGSGCKVGIGVATGADDVYIVSKGQIDLEQELLLPLVTTKDIVSGEVRWKGKYLVNPFDHDKSGRLINLNHYPKARRYFESHRDRLLSRNVGKRNPTDWYRTIDRVHYRHANTPMILIPDIKADNQTIALKEGNFYPHHNLYFVTSEYWDLRVLKAILRSDIARFFVFMYGVKMRLGYYRFQAQYLKRICLPPRIAVSESLAEEVMAASLEADAEKLRHLIATMYGLSRHDSMLLQSFDKAPESSGREEA
jgi:adenine-specific DNA-methyltransferase